MSGRLNDNSYDLRKVGNEDAYPDPTCHTAIQANKQMRTMLGTLHEECDSFDTGVVRATNLVQKLKLLVKDNPAVNKDFLDELSRLLDPKDDDAHVKKEEFVAIGMDWIAILNKKYKNELNSSCLTGIPINKEINSKPNELSGFPDMTFSIDCNSKNFSTIDSSDFHSRQVSETEEKQGQYISNKAILSTQNISTTTASFGLLDSVILKDSYFETTNFEEKTNTTYPCQQMGFDLNYKDCLDGKEANSRIPYQSIDEIKSTDTFETNVASLRDLHEHEKKLNNLININKRMSLETITLKKQLVSAESEADQIQSENDFLRKQLIDKQNDARNKISPTVARNSSGNSQTSRRHSTDGFLAAELIKNATFTIDNYNKIESVHDYNSEMEHYESQEALQGENRRLEQELQRLKKLLKESKIQEQKTIEKVDTLEHDLNVKKGEIARLRQNIVSKSDTEAQNIVQEESRLMIDRLEEEIRKLKADLTTALDEISQISVNQNQDGWREVFGEKGRVLTFSASDISFDNMPDHMHTLTGEFNEVFPVRRSVSAPSKPLVTLSQCQGPKASSTPFCSTTPMTKPLRGSIGEEMIKLGVDGSPLLGKRKGIIKQGGILPANVSKLVPTQYVKPKSANKTKCISPTVLLRKEALNNPKPNTKSSSTQTHTTPDMDQIWTEDHQPGRVEQLKITSNLTSDGISLASNYFVEAFRKFFLAKPFWFQAVLSGLTIVILFTFCGAYEIDDTKYYPMTWPKRLDDWLHEHSSWIRVPQPVAIFSKKHFYPPNVY